MVGRHQRCGAGEEWRETGKKNKQMKRFDVRNREIQKTGETHDTIRHDKLIKYIIEEQNKGDEESEDYDTVTQNK